MATDRDVERLVRQAARKLAEYYGGPNPDPDDDTLFSPAELADFTWDQDEETCYLTPPEEAELYAVYTQAVYAVLGLGGDISDDTNVTMADLLRASEEEW